MRTATQLLIGVIIMVLSAGCDMRMFSPRWESMKKQGISYVPGEYHSAMFIHNNTTDKMFAAAVDDLKKTKVKELNLQSTQLTDESIDDLLELKRLEVLYVNGTDFTLEGLLRLKALPRLERLYVAQGQFTDEEQERIRTGLPHVDVRTTPSGAWRFTQSHGSQRVESRGGAVAGGGA